MSQEMASLANPIKPYVLKNGYMVQPLRTGVLIQAHELLKRAIGACDPASRGTLLYRSLADYEMYFGQVGHTFGIKPNGDDMALLKTCSSVDLYQWEGPPQLAACASVSILALESEKTQKKYAETVASQGVHSGRVAVLQAAAVLSAFRGRHLQEELIKVRVEWARQMGMELVVCRVAKDLVPSLRNLESSGFDVKGTQEDTHAQRSYYIMTKKLDNAQSQVVPA